MTSLPGYDAWKLREPDHLMGEGPCECGHACEDHDAVMPWMVCELCHCTGYREAEPCGCGALREIDCRCDR